MCVKCEDGFELASGVCLYACQSDLEQIQVKNASRKGLCLDDTTLSQCADKMPYLWPHSDEPITSLRLFTAWRAAWPEAERNLAWYNLAQYVKAHNVKVFIGTQVSCNETDDDEDWNLVLEFVKLLGAKHVMAVAVGNEMELLYTKAYVQSDKTCIPRIWKGGYFWAKTVQRLKDIDALGDEWKQIPVTSVFGAALLGGEPFFETPNAMVASYIANATGKYKDRWVFALNVYPYFDPGNSLDPGTAHECNKSISRCTCLDKSSCLMVSVVGEMRRRMKVVTGSDDGTLWVAETGWSTPASSTLATPVVACPAFSSRDTFESYYRRFLSWEMEIEGVRGPDHIFYFTMRDSNNFGIEEHFGLIATCDAAECKLQRANDTSMLPASVFVN